VALGLGLLVALELAGALVLELAAELVVELGQLVVEVKFEALSMFPALKPVLWLQKWLSLSEIGASPSLIEAH
jgi:hypothetical protein